jgi:hypothetical protein
MTEKEARRKIKNDDFFFGEGGVIQLFGDKEAVEELKRENPILYCSLRESPCFMPPDHLTREESQKEIEEAKKEMANDI